MNHQPKRIDQILTSFSPYDAIGTEVVNMQKMFTKFGYESQIFTQANNSSMKTYRPDEYKDISSPQNILIHHFSIGTSLVQKLNDFNAYKVTRFHNITPHFFFNDPSALATRNQVLFGQIQLSEVLKQSNCIWPTSEFTKGDLTKKTSVPFFKVPVVRQYNKLINLMPLKSIGQNLKSSGRLNLIFVGRICPHKGHHDLFFTLASLKKLSLPPLRLILVGNGDDYYLRRDLLKIADTLGLSYCFSPKSKEDFDKDIIFTETINDQELSTYYFYSDIFVCMSDHEGFCVPIVEALHFRLPIVAHRSTAVTETLGYGGTLVDKTNMIKFVKTLEHIIRHPDQRQILAQKSFERSKDFENKVIQNKLIQATNATIKDQQSKLAAAEKSPAFL